MDREVVAVPKGERPLEPGDGLVVQFARDLRLLREKAGSPTYRELSARVHYSAAALSEAASGRKLPSLPVTKAYVAGCGGNTAEWETRWRTTAAELTNSKTAPEKGEDDGGRAPYVGLAAFQQEDADRFFGRDALVTDLLTRLRRHRFLGVFGASGCGKSSLLRAGLAARLTAEREQDNLPVVVLTPGQHPFEECAIHLARILGESPGTLRDEFTTDPRNLHLRIRQAATDSRSESDVVLVVDQFEELFTLCTDEQERTAFIDALVTAATDPVSRTRVVLGVRADFLGHCGQHPNLVTALRDTQVLVGPMTTDELRLAITSPAQQAGYRVETALVARLAADASQQSGMLPLVSHALLQTWQRRQGKVMTLAGYNMAGGIEHALARTAEQTYQSLDTDKQNLAQQIFLRLTALGEGTEDTKRRVATDELDHDNPNTAQVLDTLVRARLITVGRDSVEIAHEALIRHWPRLYNLLTEDRDEHRIHRQLTHATTEWERHRRDESLLYRGTRLSTWQDRPLDRLNDIERAFLTASRHVMKREHRSRRRRIRWTISGLSAATAIVATLAIVALVVATQAEHDRILAVSRQLVIEARAQSQIDPELGLLLAREAFTMAPNDKTEAALRQATTDSHIRATLSEHGGRVCNAAFSPDGRHLATSDRDGTLRVWARDVDTGHVARTAPRELDGPGCLAHGPVFSADNSRIAATDLNGELWVWDWSRGNGPLLRRDMDPEWGTFHPVAFSPDLQRMAAGGKDGGIRIWNVGTDDEPIELHDHERSFVSVMFSPDGKQLTSAEWGGTVRVWDLSNGGSQVVRQGNTPPFGNEAAISPDGRQIASGSRDGTVAVSDIAGETGSVVLGSHDGEVNSVTYSADGHWIASTGIDGTIQIWNAHHLAAPAVLHGNHEAIQDAAISPDGKTVVSTHYDGPAKVWDVDEVDDLTVLHGLQEPDSTLAASSDGRRMASGRPDGTVLVWDTTGAGTPIVLPAQNPIGGASAPQVSFSPDGRLLATADFDVHIWNMNNLTKQISIPTSRASRIAFHPDNRLLAVVTTSLSLWNTTGAGRPEQLSTRHLLDKNAILDNVAWSPNGHHIAATTEDGLVLWNLRTNTPPIMLPAHLELFGSLAFSPDSTHLASTGADGVIYIWNITDAAEPIMLRGHRGGTWSVTFSTDSHQLITTGNDATIRIWKTKETGDPIELKGFRASIDTVISLDDDRYVTAHDDGTIRIWRCRACGPIDDVLAHVNQHVTRDLTPQERQTYLSDS